MGDERIYQQSNSGGGACRITKSGRRKDTVMQAVAVVAKYPDIDSFTGSYVQGGGPLEYQDGQWKLVGKTNQLTPDELALVLKFQSRITEAKQKGYVIESARRVQRSVAASGYRVTEKGRGFIGGGSFPDKRLPKQDNAIRVEVVSQSASDDDGDVESVSEKGAVVGMPADLQAFHQNKD